MPADANKDNGVSVSELCKYINKNMYAELKKYQKADYYAMNKDEIMFGR